MTRFRLYRLATLIVAGLCLVIICEKICERIENERDEIRKKEALSAIIPFDRIDNIDPNRKVRSINRTPEMTQAFAVVSGVLKEAQKRVGESEPKYLVEVRFYRSDKKLDTQENQRAGGRIYNALQLFQFNSDGTVSPLGERQMLPPEVVLFLDDWPSGIDETNKLTCVSIDSFSVGNVVFVQTNVFWQSPFDDRMLTFLDGKIYEDGGSDIQAKVWYHAGMPYEHFQDSRVVRPK